MLIPCELKLNWTAGRAWPQTACNKDVLLHVVGLGSVLGRLWHVGGVLLGVAGVVEEWKDEHVLKKVGGTSRAKGGGCGEDGGTSRAKLCLWRGRTLGPWFGADFGEWWWVLVGAGGGCWWWVLVVKTVVWGGGRC